MVIGVGAGVVVVFAAAVVAACDRRKIVGDLTFALADGDGGDGTRRVAGRVSGA